MLPLVSRVALVSELAATGAVLVKEEHQEDLLLHMVLQDRAVRVEALEVTRNSVVVTVPVELAKGDQEVLGVLKDPHRATDLLDRLVVLDSVDQEAKDHPLVQVEASEVVSEEVQVNLAHSVHPPHTDLQGRQEVVDLDNQAVPVDPSVDLRDPHRLTVPQVRDSEASDNLAKGVELGVVQFPLEVVPRDPHPPTDLQDKTAVVDLVDRAAGDSVDQEVLGVSVPRGPQPPTVLLDNPVPVALAGNVSKVIRSVFALPNLSS